MASQLEKTLSKVINEFIVNLNENDKEKFLSELEKISEKYNKENYEDKTDEEVIKIFLEYLIEIYTLMASFKKVDKN